MNLLKYGGIQRKTSFSKGVWGLNSTPIDNESLAVKAILIPHVFATVGIHIPLIVAYPQLSYSIAVFCLVRAESIYLPLAKDIIFSCLEFC